MRTMSALFLLFGTMFTAGGYGATFLISEYFRSHGGSDIDTGTTLSVALAGTLIGVPLVGWFAGKLEASRFAALAALSMSLGYFLFSGSGSELNYTPRIAAFLIGLGWGMFYISGPMALSERISDADRGHWFTRFSAFQMAGICGSPIILTLAVEQGNVPILSAFFLVGIAGIFASLFLGTFGIKEPRHQQESSLRPWVKKITKIAPSSAIRPIIMVGLGGCVFSGMMSFQSSLVEGTDAGASTFFAVHVVTVVISRLLLSRYLSTIPRIPLVTTLMSSLILGILFLLGIPVHSIFQVIAAILTGLGYGLVYPVIQTWAVNDSSLENRHAALTWFVVSYFIGIFGFPMIGGWILVEAGKTLFIIILAAIAVLELIMALFKTTNQSKSIPKI
ncbi:MFS transporter [Xenorhabdus szentirmaii]|uniref:Similarities with transporter protein n=2 Tax=Xenorhabdus szentirmaii TaxID=290112 RepID=W1IUC8_9GAMM|nr:MULTISPECIES: MFS transporter [Xenorhabdus]MBD2781891.1 MFS transporter [Xenorhabdus sp. 38]MBD2801987.1 MFS transporter [Xenorhabdus sp. M]MBD2803241.1 MFS transporter [Xenorhabdus sp. ZM]MBD2821906.1 MFS transporter [Xenorhabdus sp. 42]MBD2825546.1 MFS transporter [Xenorhabdus sp. 5]